jgi:hypothetical protein
MNLTATTLLEKEDRLLLTLVVLSLIRECLLGTMTTEAKNNSIRNPALMPVQEN